MTLVYQSTRDANNTVTASQAILQGLATDGGLFTPVTYPKVDLDFDKLKDASYQEVAKLVLSAFLRCWLSACFGVRSSLGMSAVERLRRSLH